MMGDKLSRKGDKSSAQQCFPFDNCAPKGYDEEYSRMPRRYKRARSIQNKFVCQGLRNSAIGTAVLIDLGAGTANDGLHVLNKIRHSFYLGIDRSVPMINWATNKLRVEGYSSR